MKKPTAYSYVRFSRPEQIRGDSLRRQTELSEKYAREHGLILDTTFDLTELGVSAYHGKNATEGALSRFLSAIKEGRVTEGSYLLVESLDRLSREAVIQALPRFLDIITAGIVIVTLKDNMVYDKTTINPMQIVISIIEMTRANEESATKSKRLSAAWANKRANIEHRKLTNRCPGWLRLSTDRTTYVPIPERVALIKRMFAMAIEGKGKRLIAKTFNAEQHESFGVGKQRAIGWQDSYVQKTLRNRQVLGEFQPHRLVNGKRIPEGAPSPDYFPRIISDDDFYLAQNSLTNRKKKGGRIGQGVGNLFSNISFCGECDGTVIRIDKGDNWVYLKCSNTNRGLRCCDPNSIRYQWVEDAFIQWIVDFDFTGGEKTIRSQKEAELSRLKLEQARIKSRLRNFLDALEEEDAPVKTITPHLKQAEVELDSNEAAQNRLLAEIGAIGDSVFNGDIASLAANDKNRFRLREEIRKRVKRITFHFGDAHPTFGTSFFTVELVAGDRIEIAGRNQIAVVRDGKRYQYEAGLTYSTPWERPAQAV